MSEVWAKALYEFSGDSKGGELSFEQDDLLVVLRQDIGDGWWEARNSTGVQGLIPESYVEIYSLPEPSFPPPPVPQQFQDNTTTSYQNYEDTRNQGSGSFDSHSSQPLAGTKQPSFDDWDDDDWDDDYDDDASSCGNATTLNVTNNNHQPDSQSIQSHETRNSTLHTAGYGTMKKNYSRFSQFSRSGGESFLMGTVACTVPESDCIKIINGLYGPEWEVKSEYTCELRDPKKESKLKGLKSFVAYQLIPSFCNIAVSRRYKHFDWLHERLEEKFPCIPIPPLPEKVISGRYETEFISERMKLLQQWINRMVHHPVICQCDVFLHFLTCTDEKKWKQGKRKAEKDEYMGGKYFLTIRNPSNLDMNETEEKLDNFAKFVRNMDDNVKHLLNVFHDNMKKHHGPFKREYQKIGNAFKNIATTYSTDDLVYSKNLTTAIDHTGDAYNTIGEMYAAQPFKDSINLMEGLNEYKGILSVYPDVLKVHEGAMGKLKECQKQVDDGKLVESEMQNILLRSDTISFATLAEMNHFHQERVRDFRSFMQNYLKQQILFYQNITSQLEESLKMYENA
ncbi:sorting nexin-33-like [Argonauta hians]